MQQEVNQAKFSDNKVIKTWEMNEYKRQFFLLEKLMTLKK